MTYRLSRTEVHTASSKFAFGVDSRSCSDMLLSPLRQALPFDSSRCNAFTEVGLSLQIRLEFSNSSRSIDFASGCYTFPILLYSFLARLAAYNANSNPRAYLRMIFG